MNDARLTAAVVHDTLAALIRIPSINPALDAASVGEAAIAEHIRAWLAARGVRAALEEAAPGRPNVVAEVGTGGGPALVLCAHTDTVGSADMQIEPFEPRVEAGRIYGRGSYDMKSGAAAVMCALAALADADLPGTVYGALVCDEEHASAGARDFVRRHRADACIVTEPSALELVLAHKGFVWIEIETRGVAAHGSDWERGRSAIAAMAPVIAALNDFDVRVLRARTHPLTGPASLHCATIEGGSGVSTYAAACRVRVERRTIPGERLDDVVAEIAALVAAVEPAAELRTELARAPMTCAPDAPIARCVRDAAAAVTGRAPADAGVAYWMDAAIFAEAGIPTVNIGADGAGAHAAVEWADLDSTVRCARVLAASAARFLRGD